MNATADEPTIPRRLQRPLAAVWISLGLHAALIALVQVAPPAAMSLGNPVIEARLVSKHALPAVTETPVETPEAISELAPSASEEALPVASPVAPSPIETAPIAAETRPATIDPTTPASTPGPLPPASASTPAVTMTSSVDLTYYSARDVDVHPRALREIVPDYPADADRQRVSGKVRLQLKLEADGRVSDVDVVSSIPPDMFDESAIEAFRDVRFSPAQKNGRPVRARVLIEVEYDWEGRPR